MDCDNECGRAVRMPRVPGGHDGLVGRVTTICVECMNEHLAEKARKRRRATRPSGVDFQALASELAEIRRASPRHRGVLAHERGAEDDGR